MKSHSPYKGGKFLPGKRTEEYATNVVGTPSRSGPSKGMLGTTKGNKDLPIDRTKGVSTGHGGGMHKAGG
jgi:hypothetical protein